MTPEIDSWLTRFAAGAGTAYQWHYQRYRDKLGNTVVTCHMLRAAIDDDTRMCPLSANETYESGEILDEGLPDTAARRQGLTVYECRVVVNAADGVLGHDAEIRERLRRICRLEEPHTYTCFV